MAVPNHVQITIPKEHVDQNQRNISVIPEVEAFDCSKRAQWLRAAVLGANDGLVSVASLVMGVGVVNDEVRAMILTFFAGIFAGACRMAIGEFISMLDIEIAQMKTYNRMVEINGQCEENVVEGKLPNVQPALATLAFMLGAVVPLLAAAFITDFNVGLVVVVVAATTMALVGFGSIGAVLGRSLVAWSCARMVVGGWTAMAITFGLIKLLGSSGLEM